MPKVIIGMSGGVDSSVTAYLLKEQGYEVEGVSFVMWEATKGTPPATCCSLQSMESASENARYLGIRHSTIDIRDDFLKKVIEPFVDAYLNGLTPNPCVLCNRLIKFPHLIKEAEKRNAEIISTGHYARVESTKSKEQRARSIHNSGHFSDYFFLKKGIDPRKDQSYVLYVLRQEELKRLILPLGYYKKDDVRKVAKELNLPAAERSESQEICFIEDRKYLHFVESISPVAEKAGQIIDLNGKAIGTHKGIHGYTIGQRKGLGISSPKPLYVVNTDIQKNTVYVGPREAAKKREFSVDDLNWITPLFPPLAIGNKKGLKLRASVKVRSTMKDEPATIYIAESEEQRAVRVVFDEPQWAPAPGQSAVFYNQDRVIGGGVIKKSV